MNKVNRTHHSVVKLCAAVLFLSGTPESFCRPALADDTNLLLNPGFEEGISDDGTGWQVPLDVHVGVNTGCGREDAGNCLRISGSGPNAGIYFAQQVISGIIPGKQYNVSGWISTRGIAQAAIIVHWFRSGGSVIKDYGDVAGGVLIGTTPNESYQRQASLLTAPADAAYARVRGIALIDSDPNFTTIARFDDLSFALATPPPTPTPPSTPTPALPVVDASAPQLSDCSARITNVSGASLIRFSYSVNDNSGLSFIDLALKNKGSRTALATKKVGPVDAAGSALQVTKLRIKTLRKGKYSLTATPRDSSRNVGPACVLKLKVD